MENYRKSSHCTYDIKYHLVWITEIIKEYIKNQDLQEKLKTDNFEIS